MISQSSTTGAISAEMQAILVSNSTTNLTSASLNGTAKSNGKLDCARDCPCGVAAIPVPDQWLEVMVTGKFKVWHIIFIIIALVVTLIVVYCCFHRVRIPRTKQEIEADLMRSTLATKFRDHLQEFPNEPTTFIEALKRVQELEEKLEKDDEMLSREAGLRKRKGWLKLKGKQEQQPESNQPATGAAETGDNNTNQQQVNNNQIQQPEPINLLELARNASDRLKEQAAASKLVKLPILDTNNNTDGETKQPNDSSATSAEPKTVATSRSRTKTRAARHEPSSKPADETTKPASIKAVSKEPEAAATSPSDPSRGQSATKKRKQKPNLARSKKLARDKSQPTIDVPDTTPVAAPRAVESPVVATKTTKDNLLSVVVAKPGSSSSSKDRATGGDTTSGKTKKAKQTTKEASIKPKRPGESKNPSGSKSKAKKPNDDDNKLKIVVG